MSDPVTPSPDEKETVRIRRNRLLGRILLIALGLLLVAQMIPFLMRA